MQKALMGWHPTRALSRVGPRRLVSLAACASFASSSVVARPVRADDNAAVVEQIFSEGKRLIAAGKVAEACPKFLASYNLEHRVGTLLSLADCYERNSQIASAWARFVEVRAFATRSNQPERANYAAKHAAMLESRRSTLTIAADATIAGLVVQRDGVVVDPAIYGVAVPVDGGVYTLNVRANGKIPISTSITVAPEADRETYALPPLVDVPVEAVAATPVVRAIAPPDEAAALKKGLSARAIAGIGIAGAGVVAVGVGIYFGVAALGKKSDSAPYCGADGQKDDCFGPGVGLRSTAVSDATVSSVLIGVGAAAAVGGAVLWWTAPSSRASTTVGFDGRMLRLAAVF